MSRIFVCGLGAVSPAGWNVAALRTALDQGEPLPVQPLERPGGDKSLRARLVPAPATRLGFLAHPRLRRTSPITHYAAAAALDAVAGLRALRTEKIRLGLVVCQQAGCVNYSCRFFDEVLKDPATASPLLFPETVYAAPASHVAALLENVIARRYARGRPGRVSAGCGLRHPMAGGEHRGCLPRHRHGRNQLDSRGRAPAPGWPSRHRRRRRGDMLEP